MLARQLGPTRGAEELARQLNRVYDAIIAPVQRYGGSVVIFSGDAITCWFDADSGLRAAACALEMQTVMRPLAQARLPGGSSASLALKVAIASGPMRRFLVGDPHIQRLDVLAGPTLDTLAAVEHLTQPGEVTLASEAAASLGEQVSVSGWRVDEHADRRVAILDGLHVQVAPAPWPEPARQVSEDDARAWLLPQVYARLRQNPNQFIAEIRPAAALFVGFSGLDYGADDDAGLLLDAYLRHVQATVARYDGCLLQVTMGDKGNYLYVEFGAPIAHDDDAVRAVSAASDLRVLPAHLSFIRDVRIGVAYGQMYTGSAGNDARRTYTVVGDKTNLAARLMEAAAPGQVLVDDETFRHARSRWAFEPLAPIRVKGKAGLVRVYQPGGRPIPSGRASPAGSSAGMIGREGERARLGQVLDGLQAGAGHILIVEGEAGIGKSRLMGEFARLVRERGLIGLLGAGQSIEQQTPYRAWRDILSSFFDLDIVTDEVERRARVQRVVSELAPRLAQRLPLLNDLLNLGLPETPLTAALDPALRQESLAGLLISLLRAWANDRPLVLVLEDAHWLDSL